MVHVPVELFTGTHNASLECYVLKTLIFGFSFNSHIGPGVLPDSLEYLAFGHSYNKPLPILPGNLKTLSFDGIYNKVLKRGDVNKEVRW